MWDDTNDVTFSDYHKSESSFPFAKCVQGNENAMICVIWHLDAGKGWPDTDEQSDLRVSGPLLPLEICLQIPDQLVMRDRSIQQH